jgi:hypothetical protein
MKPFSAATLTLLLSSVFGFELRRGTVISINGEAYASKNSKQEQMESMANEAANILPAGLGP